MADKIPPHLFKGNLFRLHRAFPLQNPLLPKSPSLSSNLLSIKITAGNQFAVKDDF